MTRDLFNVYSNGFGDNDSGQYQCVDLVTRFVTERFDDPIIWGNANELYQDATSAAYDHHPNGSGYKGRMALYEVMRLNEALKEMVLQGASTAELKLGAIKNGMMTLRMSGIRKISDGVTTPEEVMRVTMGD